MTGGGHTRCVSACPWGASPWPAPTRTSRRRGRRAAHLWTIAMNHFGTVTMDRAELPRRQRKSLGASWTWRGGGREERWEVEEAVQDEVEIVAYRPPGIIIRGLAAAREGVARHAEDAKKCRAVQGEETGLIEKKKRRRLEMSSRKETRERWTRFEGPTRRVAEVGQFGRGRGREERGRERGRERERERGREAWRRNDTPAVLYYC